MVEDVYRPFVLPESDRSEKPQILPELHNEIHDGLSNKHASILESQARTVVESTRDLIPQLSIPNDIGNSTENATGNPTVKVTTRNPIITIVHEEVETNPPNQT